MADNTENDKLTSISDASAGGVSFLDGTYREALSLTREIRDYIAHQWRRDCEALSPVARLNASCESMRLTSRATQIMAWLFVQKALHAGEITHEEACAPERRLADQEICTATHEEDDVVLPDRMMELLQRSRDLYLRIQRLDAQLER
ncbi:MAG: DUF1465 family protein [Pseudomonadota bacterium]|uniref:DUF1465 family protein n=1 Tax=Fodinicurvata fenggangensis TaxID=1121830 RepID=UPI0009DF1876|nr:DUF1465 family protein [Fodinicurvata fenggangensis]